MNDLRAAVEGLPTVGHHVDIDDVLALLPEGAVLVTEDVLAAALIRWWPMSGYALMPDDVRVLLRHLREQPE